MVRGYWSVFGDMGDSKHPVFGKALYFEPPTIVLIVLSFGLRVRSLRLRTGV